MKTVISKQRDVFEKETFPHLEALWRLTWWMNTGTSSAEKIVISTMIRAYNEWPFPLDLYTNKILLFKLLIREIFGFGKQRQQLFDSKKFLAEDIMITEDLDDGNQNNTLSTFDQLGLLIPNELSEETISGIINQLRPQSRLILLLLYIGEFTYAEIAFITDLPMNSVRTILFRISRLIPVYILKHHVPETYPKKAFAETTIDRWENEGGSLVVRTKG